MHDYTAWAKDQDFSVTYVYEPDYLSQRDYTAWPQPVIEIEEQAQDQAWTEAYDTQARALGQKAYEQVSDVPSFLRKAVA